MIELLVQIELGACGAGVGAGISAAGTVVGVYLYVGSTLTY